MELGSKTHAHKILGRGPGHHTITLMDPTKKKERQRKKTQNIKNKIKKKSTKSIFDEYEIFGVLRHYHVVSMPFEQF